MEAFGAFMRKFKVSLTSMRVKFIDHCNQMSGREYNYYNNNYDDLHNIMY